MIWPTKKLGEICEEIKKEKVPIGTTPYIEIGNVDISNKKINFTNKGAVKGSVFCPSNSVLISRVRPTRGAVIFLNKKIAVSPAFTIVKPILTVNPKLLFYFLAWNKKFFDCLRKRQKGTNYPSVRESDILDFKISFPGNPTEQRKIVYVLDSIQGAIGVQDKIIEKTKELKKSLMHKLFREGTRGAKLKKTEIGEIPENWEVIQLTEVAKKIKAGGTPNTSEEKFWNGDVAFTLIEDLVSAGKFLTNTNASITKLGLNNSSSWIVPENSIILSLYATVGKPVINKIPVAITQNMLGIVPNKEVTDLEFLYYTLENSRKNLWKYTDLSVHKHITATQARKILIPAPSLFEQRKIAEILQTVDQKIEIEQKKKGLYEELFKTMLNKLMRGEIRVNNINL